MKLKRIALWLYYLYALLTSVHGAFIWSPRLAWRLAGIVCGGNDEHQQ